MSNIWVRVYGVIAPFDYVDNSYQRTVFPATAITVYRSENEAKKAVSKLGGFALEVSANSLVQNDVDFVCTKDGDHWTEWSDAGEPEASKVYGDIQVSAATQEIDEDHGTEILLDPEDEKFLNHLAINGIRGSF